jgi:site-specific DNA-methyltransferase (adenine-specific)
MKIGKYVLNRCYYIDCIEGMKNLPGKSFDLGLTDPPYNLAFKGKKNCAFGDKSNNPEKLYYNDVGDNFPDFVKSFLDEMIRVCNWVIITPGHPNLYLYIIIKKPSYYIRFWHKPNDMSYIRSDPILIYGKSRNIMHIPSILTHNLVTVKNQFGFEPIHPCPKQHGLWLDIIERARPRSVLDPFLGSGTTAQVCTFLGIPWLGFEIVGDYKIDIDRRIEIGKEMRKEAISKRDRKMLY